MWFLAGMYGGSAERACALPFGRPLAFPVVNAWGTSQESADFMASANGWAVLDGKRLDPETYRGETIQIRSFAGRHVIGVGGGLNTTGCGLWVQLPPLEPGAHVLKIRGGSGSLRVSVDYALIVDAGRNGL
ncbi:hypothetical protein QMZ92_05475 [Streptomyces sp. HNM0645]|uniref:hypothetical protein n=1 Tax=Streptomyces sp. HNM0645 TaxID=2782343 RepID=UPI0024B8446F|nr:hypothetical protein [Streptomyces sp. HNM0645]MDI9883861.1 hypothetical protein [Streptomyces sp. HNM0645]